MNISLSRFFSQELVERAKDIALTLKNNQITSKLPEENK
jgi:hypothetical protein